MCEYHSKNEADAKLTLDHCAQAIAIEKRAVAIEPDNVKNVTALANRHGWMSSVLTQQKQFDAAIEQRKLEQVLISQLAAADPDNGELQMRKTWPQIGIAEIHLRKKAGEAAVPHLQIALTDLAKEAAKYPENQHITAVQIRAHILMAQAKQQAGRGDWARHNDAARQLYTSARRKGSGPIERMKEAIKNLPT